LVEAIVGDGRNSAKWDRGALESWVRSRIIRDLPSPMQHPDALLLHRVHANEAHGRQDRLCICRVVLAALDIGFTYCAGISFASRPSLINSRAQ